MQVLDSVKKIGQRHRTLLTAALLAAGILLALALALLLLPGLYGVYQLYWGQDGIKSLFYNDLGFSEAWSSLFAVTFAFFYALVWVPLAWWTVRVLVYRFNSRQLMIAFLCWIVVYGHAPLAHALLGTNICFNQSTGAPLKWYVMRDDRIVLFDTAGYDPLSGDPKLPVTPDICRAYQKQLSGQPKNSSAADPPAIPPVGPNPTQATGTPESPSGTQRSSNGNWYYCDNPSGYYPTVPTCNSAWRPVPARTDPAPMPAYYYPPPPVYVAPLVIPPPVVFVGPSGGIRFVTGGHGGGPPPRHH